MKYLPHVFKQAKKNPSAPETLSRRGAALSNRRRPRVRVIEALENRQMLATYVITNTLDAGSGSFRQALLDANTNPGADQIVFDIAGGGVKTIAPQSPLPTITDELLIDGMSQPGYAGKPLIVLHGAAAGAQTTGLAINSPRTSVRGLAINGFGMDGIYIYGSASTGNVLSNNFIGTDASGQVAVPNGRIGIHIRAGATNVVVGGNRSTGNLLSGNGLAGVYIADAGTLNHRLSGNLVGTNSDGNAALGDSSFGLYVGQGASDTFVGTNLDGVDDENEGNVVSGGNSEGVALQENAQRVRVAGNLIGTDLTGAQKLGNKGNGVSVYQTLDSVIGGNSAVARNVISNNGHNGIGIAHGSARNLIVGNFLGLDALGSSAMGNVQFGVYLGLGAHHNVIGGSAPNSGNVISGNNSGVWISDNGTDDNRVAGNRIGLQAIQDVAVPNTSHGITIIQGAKRTIIGTDGDGFNDAGERNLISGNTWYGLWVAGQGTNDTRIAGNWIGTSSDGLQSVSNHAAIIVLDGAQRTVVGTNGDGVADDVEGNILSGNRTVGINISDTNTNFTRVSGNFIGVDATGNAPLPNLNQGILVGGGARSTLIGTNSDGLSDQWERNTIAGNLHSGVFISAQATSDTTVAGNFIGTNKFGAAAIASGYYGIVVTSAQRTTIGSNDDGVRDDVESNVVSGHSSYGIYIESIADQTRVAGNYIGTDVTGQNALPNAHGVNIENGPTNTILGPTRLDSTAFNLISGNLAHGVLLHAAGSGTIIQSNRIGTRSDGLTALGNGVNGIDCANSSGIQIVDNLVSGNGTDGVALSNINNSRLVRNLVGTNVSGTQSLPNARIGVYLRNGSADNVIGGTWAEGNVISGATSVAGVYIVESNTSRNRVSGNRIGVNLAGDAAISNANFHGVMIDSYASGNIIGTDGNGVTDDQEGNVISGNGGHGIVIGSFTSNNSIAGNIVGLNAAGTSAIPNQAWAGITVIETSTGTLVGTNGDGVSDAYERNVISGNVGYGIAINGANVRLAGNYVGTDSAGNSALPNAASGVYIRSLARNTVIGTNADGSPGDGVEGNVISGNLSGGLTTDQGSSAFVIAGNLVGTNASGLAALGNRGNGIMVSGATDVQIGGPLPVQRNVSSANQYVGIRISENSQRVQVLNNYVGTNKLGTAALGNGEQAVWLFNAHNSRIGMPGAGNVLSGNTSSGVLISHGSTFNIVQANFIGTDVSGMQALPNRTWGLRFESGAADNIAGGSQPGEGNLISGNAIDGVIARRNSADTSVVVRRNKVQGNVIGLNANRTGNIPNLRNGVTVLNSAQDTTVGSDDDGAFDVSEGNIIAGNGGRGVAIAGSALRAKVIANAIFSNGGLPIDIAASDLGDGVTPNDVLDADVGPNNRQNFPEISGFFPGATTRITGTFSGAPSVTVTLHFYAAQPVNSFNHGDARLMLGKTNVTTDASGQAMFDVVLPVASSPGDWITATATDEIGNTSEFAQNRKTEPQPPVAVAGSDLVSSEGVVVNFNGLASTDPDGDPLTYLWNFGDNTSNSNTSTSPIPTFVYRDNGTYTVTLTVTDPSGLSSMDTLTVTVQNVVPVITVSGNATTDEGSIYSLNLGSVTDPGLDTVSSYIVHWGDGTSSTHPAGGVVTHNYQDGLVDPNNPSTTRISLNVDEDTYINDASGLGGPSSTHGSDHYLWSTNYFNPGAGGSLAARPMFKFELSGIDRYTVSGDGVFRVYLNTPIVSYHHATPRRVDLYRIDSAWNANTVNWYSHPSVSYLNSQYIVFVGDNRWIEWTIPQSVIQSWIDDPASNHGLMLVNELPDSFTFDLLFASEEHPDNTPAQLSWNVTGPTRIRVDLVDEDGLHIGAGSHEVIVHNVTPTANSGGDYAVAEYSTVTLDGRGSSDPGNDIVRYEWDLDYQEGAFTVDRTGSTTTINTLDGPAQKRVALRVIDAQGATSAISASTFSTLNVAPTTTVTGPTTAVPMREISLNLSATDRSLDDQAAGFRFEIDWEGNGSDVEFIDSLTTAALASHVFTTGGSKNIRVRSRDKDGDWSAVTTHTVDVQQFQFDGSLQVGGTFGNDTLTLVSGPTPGTVTVALNSVNLGTFAPSSIQFYAGPGTDSIAWTGTDLPNVFYLRQNQLALEGLNATGVDVEAWSVSMIGGDDILRVYGGSATVNGGVGIDQIVSLVAGPVTWEVTGTNAGSMRYVAGEVQFTNVETLVGFDGDDNFRFRNGQRISGRALGGGGTDVIDYSEFQTAVSVNLQTSTASQTGGIDSIERVLGGSGSDTLIGRNLDTVWQLSGPNSGTADAVAYDSFENLTGGTGLDRFVFASSATVGGNINAGAGNDVLDYSQYAQNGFVNLATSSANAIVGTFASISEIRFPLGMQNSVQGREASTTWTISGNNSVASSGITFLNVTSVQSGTLQDTVVGTNNPTSWQVTDANQALVNGIEFAGVENLIGGSADDLFVLSETASISGTINGAAGLDQLSYIGWQAAITVNLATRRSNNVGAFLGINKFTGGASPSDQIIGEDNTNVWTINGPNQGTVDAIDFEGVEQIAGGSQADTFNLTGGMVSQVNGAGGTDLLSGDAQPTLWTISGQDAGTLNTLSFQSIERLAGSSSDDEFNFLEAGLITGSIGGGAGVDSLSYALRTSLVTVSLALSTATSTGGFTSIENFDGGSGQADVFTGRNAVNNWQLSDDRIAVLNGTTRLDGFDSLVGGSSVDTFVIGTGISNSPVLNGAGGNDVLSFAGRSDDIVINRETSSATGVPQFSLIEQFIGGDGVDTLRGTNTVTTWSFTGSGTGTFTGGTFSSLERVLGGTAADTFSIGNSAVAGELIGGGGADSLTAANAGNSWRLTGYRSGSLNSVLSFDNIGSLRGGSLADWFSVEANADGFVTVDTGNGSDTIDYSLLAKPASVNLATRVATEIDLLSNVESLIGSGLADTLTGPDANTVWTITGTNAGRVGAITFSGFEALEGGTGNDTFTVNTGSIGSLSGGAGTDTLIGPNLPNEWDLNGTREGLLNSVIHFSNVENLTGNASTDTFLFSEMGDGFGTVNGGSGYDRLDYSQISSAIAVDLFARTSPKINSFLAIEAFTGTPVLDTLIGPNSATVWTLSDVDTGRVGTSDFSGFESLRGGSQDDSFRIMASVASLNGSFDGGAGVDTVVAFNMPNSWQLSGSGISTLNTSFDFSGVEQLTGGTGTDLFIMADIAATFMAINGGGGSDTLDYSNYAGPVTVNFGTRVASGIGVMTSIEALVGSSYSDLLVGADTATTWTINSAYQGALGAVTFEAFESIQGGIANDTFRVISGFVDSVAGGLGTDTLIGSNTPSSWTVDGLRSGTLNADLSFAEIENLTGGTADDVFFMNSSGSIPGTLSGGTGTNTLSYEAWGNDVSVNATPGIATAVGALAANFAILIGGSGNDTLQAFGTLASVLIGNDGNDQLDGSSARDILFGGRGQDMLLGGGNDDILFGGRSSFDLDPAALKALLAEWTSNRTYLQRVNNLRNGPTTGTPLNGNNWLANSPVDSLFDDEENDSLIGGTGTDWFIGGLNDSIINQAVGELIDNS